MDYTRMWSLVNTNSVAESSIEGVDTHVAISNAQLQLCLQSNRFISVSNTMLPNISENIKQKSNIKANAKAEHTPQ